MTTTVTRHDKRPVIAHSLRILAVPIILFWIVVAVGVNVLAPQLEVVGEQHSAPMAPEDAPSMVAMKRMGANFKEFNSNSTIMIVVEGQKPLGPDGSVRPRGDSGDGSVPLWSVGPGRFWWRARSWC